MSDFPQEFNPIRPYLELAVQYENPPNPDYTITYQLRKYFINKAMNIYNSTPQHDHMGPFIESQLSYLEQMKAQIKDIASDVGLSVFERTVTQIFGHLKKDAEANLGTPEELSKRFLDCSLLLKVASDHCKSQYATKYRSMSNYCMKAYKDYKNGGAIPHVSSLPPTMPNTQVNPLPPTMPNIQANPLLNSMDTLSNQIHNLNVQQPSTSGPTIFSSLDNINLPTPSVVPPSSSTIDSSIVPGPSVVPTNNSNPSFNPNSLPIGGVNINPTMVHAGIHHMPMNPSINPSGMPQIPQFNIPVGTNISNLPGDSMNNFIPPSYNPTDLRRDPHVGAYVNRGIVPSLNQPTNSSNLNMNPPTMGGNNIPVNPPTVIQPTSTPSSNTNNTVSDNSVASSVPSAVHPINSTEKLVEVYIQAAKEAATENKNVAKKILEVALNVLNVDASRDPRVAGFANMKRQELQGLIQSYN